MPASRAIYCIGCVFLFSICLLVGCGKSGGKYQVSGSATFAGKAIPAGKIYFTPDGAKGNIGAAGWADIKEGKFDTRLKGGQATVGGPMIVRIEGVDGISVSEDNPYGNPLFPAYETQVDMPKGSGTKDFDVPAGAVNAKPSNTGQSTIVP